MAISFVAAGPAWLEASFQAASADPLFQIVMVVERGRSPEYQTERIITHAKP